MKKLLFLLSVLLLVGMIAPARADVTPSQIVKEYKVGDKTYCLVKRSDFYRLTRPEMNAACLSKYACMESSPFRYCARLL